MNEDKRQLMEDTLFMNLMCDHLVAKYALTLTNYQSVEAAAEFIFVTDDSGLQRHPFVGYLPYEEEVKDEEMG